MGLRKGKPGCIIYALNCMCVNGATVQNSSVCVSIQYCRHMCCLYALHLWRRVPWIATPKIYSLMLIVYASLAIPFTVF